MLALNLGPEGYLLPNTCGVGLDRTHRALAPRFTPRATPRFARRFAPSRAVPLDEGESLAWNGRRYGPGGDGCRRLDNAGAVLELEAA